MFDRLGWIIVAVVGLVTLTQLLRWSAPLSSVAIVQALTPHLGLLLLPTALLALWFRRYHLVTVSAACGFALLVLATPLAFPGPRPDPTPGAVGLRVASANLYYGNDQVTDVVEALAEVDPDVIVFSEYTAAHQEALNSTSLAAQYPYRIESPGRGASGISVWSSLRLTPSQPPDTELPSLRVTVDGPDGPVEIIGMHIVSPVADAGQWRSDLAVAEQVGRAADGPLLLIGDLNTSYWHPDFRRLLDAGFDDAHIATGEGFASSWPTTWITPAFVGIDHALTTDGLVATDTDEFDIPGSDHRGIVVSVAPTAPAGS